MISGRPSCPLAIHSCKHVTATFYGSQNLSLASKQGTHACNPRTDVVVAPVIGTKVAAALVVVADVLVGIGRAGGFAAGHALQPDQDVAGRGGAGLEVGQAQRVHGESQATHRRGLDAARSRIPLGPAAWYGMQVELNVWMMAHGNQKHHRCGHPSPWAVHRASLPKRQPHPYVQKVEALLLVTRNRVAPSLLVWKRGGKTW